MANDPLVYLQQQMEVAATKMLNDTPVMYKDLRRLNPLNVQYWVASHFSDISNKRFELNVVGDFDSQNVLLALQRWFGGMKDLKQFNVGYNPYNPAHVCSLSFSNIVG